MTKLTKIRYLFCNSQITNIPKYLALAGLFYSSVLSPLQATAETGMFQMEKPALLAMGQLRPFLSLSGQMTEPEQPSNELTLINGTSLIGQTNPTIGIENSESLTVTKNSRNSYQKLSVLESQNVIDVRRGVIVTAYSSTPDQCDASPFITAKGTHVRDGIVAANWLKFGTKVRLPEVYGDKVFVVEDRMAKRNSYKLDVWMETRTEALQFGVKRLTLEILN